MRLFLSCSRLTAFSWFESWIQLEHAFPSCCTHCDLSTCIPTPLRSLLFAPFADLGFDAKDLQTQLLMNSQANLLHNGSNRRQRTSRVSQAHLFQRKTNHQTVGTITHLFLNRILNLALECHQRFSNCLFSEENCLPDCYVLACFTQCLLKKAARTVFNFCAICCIKISGTVRLVCTFCMSDGIFGRLFLPKWLDCGRTAS